MFFSRKPPEESVDSAELESGPKKITFMVKREVKQHLEAGRACLNAGKVDEALQCYQLAVDKDPSCALSYFNLGYALHESKQYDSAQEAYRRAIELEPTCSLFLENLGRLQFEMLDFAEAARHFQRAAMVGSIQNVSLGLWGRALLEQGLYQQAVEAFENLLEREQPEEIIIGAKYWLAVAHIKLGRMAAARRKAQQILAYASVDAKILSELAEQFVEVRCLSLAREILERIEQDENAGPFSELRLEDILKIENQIDESLPRLFDGDEERLLHQIHSLREFGNHRISKALLSLIDSPSAPVREAIIRYQTAFGYDVSNHVLPYLSDEVSYVRDAAYTYFEKLDRGDYIQEISKGLQDPSPEIRKRAAGLLGRFGTVDMLPILEMWVGDPGSKACQSEMRQAIASIKRRFQKKQDTLYKMKVVGSDEEEKSNNHMQDVRFWLLLFLQICFVVYFIYFLFTRL